MIYATKKVLADSWIAPVPQSVFVLVIRSQASCSDMYITEVWSNI